jgi:hypothetical protein
LDAPMAVFHDLDIRAVPENGHGHGAASPAGT